MKPPSPPSDIHQPSDLTIGFPQPIEIEAIVQ
jgi:hypothetical protein